MAKLDVRKYAVVLVVAVLFAAFIFSAIEAVYPSPEYEDYCGDRPGPAKACEIPYPDEQGDECRADGGRLAQDAGCTWYCEMCSKGYDDAREVHDFWQFIIASALGIIGIAAGLWLPTKKSPLHEWIGTGIMLGGIFAIFIATMIDYQSLHRVLRPFILLGELLLVIFLTYKKLKT